MKPLHFWNLSLPEVCSCFEFQRDFSNGGVALQVFFLNAIFSFLSKQCMCVVFKVKKALQPIKKNGSLLPHLATSSVFLKQLFSALSINICSIKLFMLTFKREAKGITTCSLASKVFLNYEFSVVIKSIF